MATVIPVAVPAQPAEVLGSAVKDEVEEGEAPLECLNPTCPVRAAGHRQVVHDTGLCDACCPVSGNMNCADCDWTEDDG